jgi:hypothetical protein
MNLLKFYISSFLNYGFEGIVMNTIIACFWNLLVKANLTCKEKFSFQKISSWIEKNQFIQQIFQNTQSHQLEHMFKVEEIILIIHSCVWKNFDNFFTFEMTIVLFSKHNCIRKYFEDNLTVIVCKSIYNIVYDDHSTPIIPFQLK